MAEVIQVEEGRVEGGEAHYEPTTEPRPQGPPISYTLPSYPLEFLVPTQLSLEGFKAAGRFTSREAARLWPKAACVVHSVLERGIYSDTAKEDGGVVPLCARVWQRCIGRDYRRVLLILRAMGVLELVSGEVIGGENTEGRSRRYRIGPAYSAQPLRWEGVKCAPLVRKLGARRRAAGAKLVGAQRAVWRHVKDVVVPPALVREIEAQTTGTQLAQARRLIALRDIQRGALWVSAPEGEADRLYHSVVNLPKSHRQRLLLAGEPVGEADISAAVPFFCLSLYAGEDADERERYAAAVCGGRFYEIMRDALPESEAADYRSRWETERGAFKARYQRDVLCTVLRGKPSPLFVAFRELFPRLAEKIAKARRTKDGVSKLSTKLRGVEAALFFGRIVPRIMREVPECRPVTLHDGIMCQLRFVQCVRAVIISECLSTFAAAPAVN